MFFLFKIQIVHKFSVLFLYRSPLQHQQNGHLQPSQKWHAKVNSLYTRKFKLNLINIYCCLKIGENRRNTANNRNFRKFSCLGLLYPRFTTIKATIWHEIVNLCCIVPYQILPWWCRPITVIYICRPARLKTAKNRDFDRILYFWGSPFHLNRFIMSPLRGKKHKFHRISNFIILWWRNIPVQRQSRTRMHKLQISLIQRYQIVRVRTT